VLVASGDLSGARARFEESLKIAERLAAANPTSADAQRDISVTLIDLGYALVASGDLLGARARFEESLKIAGRLAAANPTSADVQRDIGVSLNMLGEVLVASGDLSDARARFEESLKIREWLAAANPSSAEAQRDLIVNHVKLTILPGGELHWSEALRIALDLKSQGRLAPRDAWMIEDLQKRVADAEKAKQ
jgi:tetratricopeptide (TPR) repeat protein